MCNQHFQQGLFTMACRIASGAQVSHFLQPEELFLTSSIKPIPEEHTFLIKYLNKQHNKQIMLNTTFELRIKPIPKFLNNPNFEFSIKPISEEQLF